MIIEFHCTLANRVSVQSPGLYFQSCDDIDYHHKLSRQYGGSDKYDNLILIYATDTSAINKYIKLLNLDKRQLAKLNKLGIISLT